MDAMNFNPGINIWLLINILFVTILFTYKIIRFNKSNSGKFNLVYWLNNNITDIIILGVILNLIIYIIK